MSTSLRGVRGAIVVPERTSEHPIVALAYTGYRRNGVLSEWLLT
jgi:hypothetical protein